MTSMINTNVFFFSLVATHQETLVVLEQKTQSFSRLRQVREVFIVHVGGTRGATSKYRQHYEQTGSGHFDC